MKTLLFALAVLLSACSSYASVPPQPPGDPQVSEPGTPVDCQAACAALRAHHCPSGDPTPQGGSCEDVCNSTEASGYASMHPRCLAKIQSCDGVDACANP